MPRVRSASADDLQAITDIYNSYVLTSTATFDREPRSVEAQRSWLRAHDRPMWPVVVAEEDERILGWASLSQWSDRSCYDATVEISVYVERAERGKGVGTGLVRAVMAIGEANGVHCIIARITEGNAVSVRLFETHGFEHVGTMREVGWKFGSFQNVVTMQRLFPGDRLASA